jgi:poly-beta-1,6-N-acetyl-D-glucosamine synthase
MNKKKVAILIPAHNEQTVIAPTILSALKIVSKEDIYVVSDGSTDQTGQIAKRYTDNVLELFPNVGKASATNQLIEVFKLYENYEYILPMDADTDIVPDYLEKTLPILEADRREKIACVVGRVVGRSSTWVTAYRVWEYEITQSIHKSAQDVEGAVAVCPGCATIYRAKIFEKNKIPTGTLTEDMDFTYLIHRKKLGQIKFCSEAKVITQDPKTLKDLLKQIDRWYTGFWQCTLKHEIPWKGDMLDVEVGLLALEGLFNGLLMISFIFLIPFILLKNPLYILIPLFLDLGMLMIPTLLWVAKKHRNFKIFKYIFHFYLVRVLSSLVFLKGFIKVVLERDLTMGWNKATRYKIENRREDNLWLSQSQL